MEKDVVEGGSIIASLVGVRAGRGVGCGFGPTCRDGDCAGVGVWAGVGVCAGAGAWIGAGAGAVVRVFMKGILKGLGSAIVPPETAKRVNVMRRIDKNFIGGIIGGEGNTHLKARFMPWSQPGRCDRDFIPALHMVSPHGFLIDFKTNVCNTACSVFTIRESPKIEISFMASASTNPKTKPLPKSESPLFRYPPFPSSPPDVQITPYSQFHEYGIRLYGLPSAVEDGPGDIEIDGLGIPTLALRIRHETDTCKSFTRGREKTENPQQRKAKSTLKEKVGEPALVTKKDPILRALQQRHQRGMLFAGKEWYEQWAEGEAMRGTTVYDK